MSSVPMCWGRTSTTSAPTTSKALASVRHASSRSDDVIPPGSGVPVPGANAGSSTSTSTEMNTGPSPTAASVSATTARIPRSRTSCMKCEVMPRERCQANSSSPGQ